MGSQNARSTHVDFTNSEITVEISASETRVDTRVDTEVADATVLKNRTKAEMADASALKNSTKNELSNTAVTNKLDSPEALPEASDELESVQSIVYVSDEFDDEENYIGIFYNSQNEMKTRSRLIFIVVTMITLFLLIGFLAMMYTSQSQRPSTLLSNTVVESQTTLAPLSSEIESKPSFAAIDAKKSLSDILSSRIALISSENPKFIVTAAGQKIIPTDIIKGKLTVVDIFPTHVLVSSNGITQELDY